MKKKLEYNYSNLYDCSKAIISYIKNIQNKERVEISFEIVPLNKEIIKSKKIWCNIIDNDDEKYIAKHYLKPLVNNLENILNNLKIEDEFNIIFYIMVIWNKKLEMISTRIKYYNYKNLNKDLNNSF